MNILETIRNWSRITPRQPAQVGSGSFLSYSELENKSDALAAHLVVTLPDDHSPVLVKGHKEPEMLVGFLGAVKSGHPYIPINSSIPPQREEAIRITSKAALTLTPGTINRLSACTQQFSRKNCRCARPVLMIPGILFSLRGALANQKGWSSPVNAWRIL